jgi:hypothetical protein
MGRMKQKRTIIGIVAAALMLTATLGNSSKIVSSAHSFRQHFQAMETSGRSLGPLERFVYSLVLANSDVARGAKHVQHTDPRI